MGGGEVGRGGGGGVCGEVSQFGLAVRRHKADKGSGRHRFDSQRSARLSFLFQSYGLCMDTVVWLCPSPLMRH